MLACSFSHLNVSSVSVICHLVETTPSFVTQNTSDGCSVTMPCGSAQPKPCLRRLCALLPCLCYVYTLCIESCPLNGFILLPTFHLTSHSTTIGVGCVRFIGHWRNEIQAQLVKPPTPRSFNKCPCVCCPQFIEI